jgi:hypothetical protein
MTFFSKRILEELREREEEISSEKSIETNSIAEIRERLSHSRPAEIPYELVPAAAAFAGRR